MSLEALRSRLAARRAELHARRVLVLAGGSSAEREVSLSSGRAVAAALLDGDYRAALAEVAADSPLMLQLADGAQSLLALADGRSGVPAADPGGGQPVPIIVSMLHGTEGENGTWQGLLELLGLPHTSAGVKGSAVAMDKVLSKRLFESLGVPTPRWSVLVEGSPAGFGHTLAGVHDLVAKPISEGSSVGLMFFSNTVEGWEQAQAQLAEFGSLLIEQRITGRELTLSIIGNPDEATALPLVEIRPRSGVYDYDSKYTTGASEYICPAEMDWLIAEEIQDLGLQVYLELDLAPCARFDLMLDAQGKFYFLEANTLPGFTPTSLLPKAAQAAGIGYSELLELLMLCGLERWERGFGYKRGGA